MATSGKGEISPLLDELIKGLAGWDYEVKSAPDYGYNCIAYAADEEDRFWWPTADRDTTYWPDGIPAVEAVEAFVAAYGSIGYHLCEDDSYDPTYEKIAIYVSEGGAPRHAAKQIDDIYWKSKLGNWHDIKHPLRALEEEYGAVEVFMRRLRRST